MPVPASSQLNSNHTAARQASTDPRAFQLHSRQSVERIRLESYISSKYHQVHEASISEFLPLLLEMRGIQTEGCLGLRPGCFKPMFLEQYLKSPVEQQVARLTQQPIDRHALVEVGNLAATRKGSWIPLFVVMSMALYEAGFEWMVFTVTQEVERLMHFLNFQPRYLAPADPVCLENNQQLWGRYYEHNPRVMVGNLRCAAIKVKEKTTLASIAHHHSQAIETIAESLLNYRRLPETLK